MSNDYNDYLWGPALTCRYRRRDNDRFWIEYVVTETATTTQPAKPALTYENGFNDGWNAKEATQ